MKRWWSERLSASSSSGMSVQRMALSQALHFPRTNETHCGRVRYAQTEVAPSLSATRTSVSAPVLYRKRVAAALHVQQRLHATRTSPTTSTTTTVEVTDLDEEAFRKIFSAAPPAHRLAAATVAHYQVKASYQKIRNASEATPPPCMPMFAFVRMVPATTRDDMFQRQQDAVRWVEASPLLRLVDEQGNPISAASAAAPSSSSSSGEQGVSGDSKKAPMYNPLLHVGLVAAPTVVLREVESSTAAFPTTDAPSEKTRSGGGDAELRQAIVTALRTLEHRAVRGVVAAQRSTLPTPGAAEDSESGDRISRYEAWGDVVVLVRHHLIANDGDDAPSMRCEQWLDALQRVLNTYCVPVPLGRPRHVEEGQQHPPSLPDVSEFPFRVVRETVLTNKGRRVVTFVALRYAAETQAPFFHFVYPRITKPTVANNFGGWGSENIVPTKADVYEVLKYIPVNWANMGCLDIPAEVKRLHIRTASSQQWFRRQPFYFELRNIVGTVEIRRSIVLHPEAHGLTKEAARELLELQIATGEANNLVYLTGNGEPVEDGGTLLERSAVKFLQRVCPTYFAPMFLTAQRYTKKNLTEAAMLLLARKRRQDFEELTTRFSDVVLIRRRSGSDSSRWRAAFVADLEQYPEDVRGIMILCGYMCPAWDRPEYIYVRLTEVEQQAIGGYAGMMRVLQRHPTIFRVGKHFVCRADPSDPLSLQEDEPAHDDVTARSLPREENPYLSMHSVALVFHYVAPDDEPCTVAYLADCASPAIRTVLPTRIVSIVQDFPRLFACTETSPGVFAIRKLKQRVYKPRPRRSGLEVVDNAAAARSAAAATSAAQQQPNDEELIHMLEEEIAEEEHLTRHEVVEAVRSLVPTSGVDAEQLLVWASMPVQRAANEYFGGLVKLVEARPQHFRVVQSELSKTVYRV